jgi:chemotaxis protein MotD
MNKMDPMMAAFRQLAAGQLSARIGATAAKEANAKADHFRDQLRSVAQGARHQPKSDTGIDGNVDAKQDADGKSEFEGAAKEMRALKLLDQSEDRPGEVKGRTKGRGAQSHEGTAQQGATESTAQPADWRPPDVVLSSVMSKFEQARTITPRDEGAAPGVTHRHGPVGDLADVPDLAITPQSTDVTPEQRFSLSVNTAETRTTPGIKVAVRDQETHFEPVPQLTQLQKIVDRMATDLTASPLQANADAPEVAAPDPLRTSDKPVRLLTLQLDPPDLGAVTVKMRLAGDAIQIHLSADRYETTQMLRQERGQLADLMQSAGYSFDIASIDHTRTGDAGAGNGQPQQQPDQRPSQPSMGGGAQFGNGSPERQSNDAQSGARHGRQGHDQVQHSVERNSESSAAPNRNGGAVYL